MPVATSTSQGDTLVVLQNGHEKIAAAKNGLTHGHGITPTKARVFLQEDGKIIGEYRLHKTMLTIGRSPTSDIPISSQRVSRLHAILRWKNGAWVIEDAESLNGLSCQGQRIDQLALVDGDQIYLDPTIVLQYDESLE